MLGKIVDEVINKTGVDLIYLTGSRLTGVANKDSDYDFYGFTQLSRFDYLIKDTEKGVVSCGDNWEAKIFPLPHLISLLKKSNPNVLEMFYNLPVYRSDDLRQLSGQLFQCRGDLPYIDYGRFVKSCYGMMKGNAGRLKKDKTFEGLGSFGKELYNFNKAYRYGKAVAGGGELQVLLAGEFLEKEKRIKSITEWNESLMGEEALRTKLEDMKARSAMVVDEKDYYILEHISRYLPLYKGEFKQMNSRSF